MKLCEVVEILNERYPSDGSDPLEECWRIKEEISRETANLPYDGLMKYYEDCGVDDSGIRLENLTREEYLKILDEEDRRSAAQLKNKVACA